ncbi:MAG: hypothetical protein LBR58_02025 [Propionibacteriaceae bacterium]|jgi:hypothetical protein|nr:hypothetical protein [Propionibacteriaceae bacterium]
MKVRPLAAMAVAFTVLAAAPAAHADDIGAWDGPTYNLGLGETTYTTTSDSFLGTPVVVPGDDIHRTLRIHNRAPQLCDDAVVSVLVTDVLQDVPPGAVNSELEDLTQLYWDVQGQTGSISYSAARKAGDVQLAEFRLAPGADATVQVGYRFPASQTAGRSLGQASVVESFNVTVRAHDGCQDQPDTPQDPDNPGIHTGGLLNASDALPYALMCLITCVFAIALIRTRKRRR